MAAAKQGDTVKVNYTGSLEDGTIFDTSADRQPLQFTIGGGNIIKGFEDAVIGMNPGDSKKISIKSEEAYGPHLEELVVLVQKNQFPENMTPEIGQQFEVRGQDGYTGVVTVTEISEAGVTLDGNHPLAGQDLNFEIQLMEII